MRNLNRKICFFLMVLLIFILLPEVKIKAIDDIQIISSTKITANEAKIWAKRKGATDTFIGLADLYWKYSSSNGNVNPAVAYVQAAVETGYGKFGGVIDESYKNPLHFHNPYSFLNALHRLCHCIQDFRVRPAMYRADLSHHRFCRYRLYRAFVPSHR